MLKNRFMPYYEEDGGGAAPDATPAPEQIAEIDTPKEEAKPEPKTKVDIEAIRAAGKSKKSEPKEDPKIVELEAKYALLKNHFDKEVSEKAALKKQVSELSGKKEEADTDLTQQLAELTKQLEETTREKRTGNIKSQFAKRGVADDEALETMSKTLAYAPDEVVNEFFDHFSQFLTATVDLSSQTAVAEFVKSQPDLPRGQSTNLDSTDAFLDSFLAGKKPGASGGVMWK